MQNNENPVLKITEKDLGALRQRLSKSPVVVGVLDTSGLSKERVKEIGQNACPGCPANIENVIFDDTGRQNPPPFACISMGQGASQPRVDFAPPPKGKPIDINVTRFLSAASCKPSQG